MITLRRLDLVRADSPATAEELQSLQTQLNALPLFQAEPHLTVRERDTAEVTPFPAMSMDPSGFIELQIRGKRYVLPFFAKVE